MHSFIKKIAEQINNLPPLNLRDLDNTKTSLFIIDMINGFVKEGALQSDRSLTIVDEVVKLSNLCDKLKIKKVAFADCHPEESPEFIAYPPHCIKGTREIEVISELQEIGGYQLINKNSTNAYLEPEFQNWLKENQNINTFIIVGVCTDICVLQFALSIKAHFNRLNQNSRIIVPVNAVNTYDVEMHHGDFMHLFSLYNMMINNIEIVKKIIV